MYIKLICRNVRRSVRDYLIYIVTMTLCVTLFYGFLSISSRYYNPDLGLEYDLTMLSGGMKLAICAVTLLLLFLIRYVDSYMVHKKQKEFAIQTVLGMERNTTAALFFAETFLMGLLSIGLGTALGAVSSQFVTAMLLSSYGKPFSLSLALFPDTVLITFLFFTAAFLASGLWDVRTIRQLRILSMLTAEKENEADFRQGRWMPVLTAVYGIALVFRLTVGISKMYYYFDSRYPAPVHVMFLGNILVPAAALLFLVLWFFVKKRLGFTGLILGWLACAIAAGCFAASVPSVTMDYFLPLGTGGLNQYLMFLLTDMVYFLCGFFYLAGDFLCLIKEKFPNHRFRGENLFFYGQIISKLKTTTKTMTLICLTLVLSICLFMAAPALTGWASGYLDYRSVYDVQISTMYNQVYDEADLPRDSYDMITEYLKEHSIETAYDLTFLLYLPKREDFHKRVKYEFPALAISLSDYNYLLSMFGLEPVKLEDGTFATQWDATSTEQERNEFLEGHSSLETDWGVLRLGEEPQFHHSLGETIYNSYTNMVYVLPDEVCAGLLPVNQNRYIKTVKPIPFQQSAELGKLFSEQYPEEGEGAHYYIRTSTQQINSTKASNFVLQTSMTYGAIVLLVSCFTILSLQQLMEADHYQYRFHVLKVMGVEARRRNRLAVRQLCVWFGLPIGMAALVSSVLVVYFFQTISVQIAAYIGLGTLLVQVGAIAAVLVVLLLCYFVSTWILLKRSVT